VVVVNKPLKVLHVTESFASGVMDLIATITARQVEEGASVHVLYAFRPDTPSDDALAQIFAPGVRLIGVSERKGSKLVALLKLRLALGRELKQNYDAVHLHSTLAGVLGRVAIGHRRLRNRTFYSPHGFGFLRQDLNPLARRIALVAERVAGRRGALILTTDSELDIAKTSIPRARCELVVNGIDVSALPKAHDGIRARPQVAMVGRVTYQKAPWVFAQIAEALKQHADFVWFGDGAEEDKARWLVGQPVELTGWMPLPVLRTRLAQSDIILFPTLWEGMPVSPDFSATAMLSCSAGPNNSFSTRNCVCRCGKRRSLWCGQGSMTATSEY